MLTYKELATLSNLPMLKKVNRNLTSDMIVTHLMTYHKELYDELITEMEIKQNVEGGIKLSEDSVQDFIEMVENIIATKKINAIKICRKISGMGLKEAKEYVESITIPEAQQFMQIIGDEYPALVV